MRWERKCVKRGSSWEWLGNIKWWAEERCGHRGWHDNCDKLYVRIRRVGSKKEQRKSRRGKRGRKPEDPLLFSTFCSLSPEHFSPAITNLALFPSLKNPASNPSASLLFSGFRTLVGSVSPDGSRALHPKERIYPSQRFLSLPPDVSLRALANVEIDGAQINLDNSDCVWTSPHSS